MVSGKSPPTEISEQPGSPFLTFLSLLCEMDVLVGVGCRPLISSLFISSPLLKYHFFSATFSD